MKLIDSTKRYFKGNTHAHTTRSDGSRAPEAVLETYRAAGYDFLAVTDHWRSFPAQMYGDMRVLCGEEFDFDFDDQALHIVGVFPDEGAAQGLSRGMDHRALISAINASGGAAIAAHPAWSLNTPEFLRGLEGVCAAEVYNTFSGEPWNAPRADSTGVLDLVAAAGRCIPQLAADDSHMYEGEQCRSFTMLQADSLRPEDILSALRRGSFYASQGPRFLDVELNGRELVVRTSPVCRVNFISNKVWSDGRCRSGAGMTEQAYRIRPGERFIRCEIMDEAGRRAWLSPVLLDGGN